VQRQYSDTPIKLFSGLVFSHWQCSHSLFLGDEARDALDPRTIQLSSIQNARFPESPCEAISLMITALPGRCLHGIEASLI
jgi:hypothetical protein